MAHDGVDCAEDSPAFPHMRWFSIFMKPNLVSFNKKNLKFIAFTHVNRLKR